MNEMTSKVELLDAIGTERARLEALIAPLDHSRLTEPALDGGWSVKDVMAHIVDWEQYVVRLLQACARGERPVPRVESDADIDRINQQVYDANKDRPLTEVRADFARSYQEIRRAADALSEADLFDPSRREAVGGTDRVPVWQRIAVNTSFHYEEHSDAIEAWLKASQ